MIGSTTSLNLAGCAVATSTHGMIAPFALAQAAVDFRRGRRVRTPFASVLHEVLSRSDGGL